jgi:hypothetical protein
MGIILQDDKKRVLKISNCICCVKEIVLKESYNRKLTYLLSFEFREKKLKCKLVPIHVIKADLDSWDKR